jgi:hypothetical protein
VRIEPRVLLSLADEMAGLAGEREAESGLAILAAHAALEAFVNDTGAREISSGCRRSGMRSSGTRARQNGWTAGQRPCHRRSPTS